MAIVSHSPFSGSSSSQYGQVSWPTISATDVLENLFALVLNNPESSFIAAAPLPIIGAPFTPQQLIWRQSLQLAGIQTGIFKGDDQIAEFIGSSLSLPSQNSMWVGPGVEWFV